MAKSGKSEPLSKPTPTLAIEHVRVGELRPADYNPRMMSGEARKRLKRSVAEFGMVDPIIARRSDNLVVGGHQRLTAALDLGLETVPVVYLDELDDKRAAALNVALNNRNIAGEYDLPKLAELLTTLDVDGFDATLTGFDEAEIAKMLSWTPDLGPGGVSGEAPLESDQWICTVACTSERELAALYDRLNSEGYACKLIT